MFETGKKRAGRGPGRADTAAVMRSRFGVFRFVISGLLALLSVSFRTNGRSPGSDGAASAKARHGPLQRALSRFYPETGNRRQ